MMKGLGLPTLLLVVFITLKLINVIDWSWWWVLSPLWIEFIIGMIMYIVIELRR